MEKERAEEHIRLRELNDRFLKEIEVGKKWEDVRYLLDEMKKIAKRLDHLPARVVQFDNYPLKNTGEGNVT